MFITIFGPMNLNPWALGAKIKWLIFGDTIINKIVEHLIVGESTKSI